MEPRGHCDSGLVTGLFLKAVLRFGHHPLFISFPRFGIVLFITIDFSPAGASSAHAARGHGKGTADASGNAGSGTVVSAVRRRAAANTRSVPLPGALLGCVVAAPITAAATDGRGAGSRVDADSLGAGKPDNAWAAQNTLCIEG